MKAISVSPDGIEALEGGLLGEILGKKKSKKNLSSGVSAYIKQMVKELSDWNDNRYAEKTRQQQQPKDN